SSSDLTLLAGLAATLTMMMLARTQPRSLLALSTDQSVCRCLPWVNGFSITGQRPERGVILLRYFGVTSRENSFPRARAPKRLCNHLRTYRSACLTVLLLLWRKARYPSQKLALAASGTSSSMV